jgi:hypothetical protein
VIDHLILVDRRRRQQDDQIMPLLRRGLGRRTVGDVVEPDVVDDHLGVVPLAPLLE